MLTPSKSKKLLAGIKDYRKRFFSKEIQDLDESGTRIMVNHILTDMLGYKSLEEIKTEYMIKGTYADYVVQIDGNRHFLVEVKALSISLSNKHLRQAVEYAANEGIEWVVLTNGRALQLYKVVFSQPIESKYIFGIDLSVAEEAKMCLECLKYLHRDSVLKKGLNQLWNNFIATEKNTIASILLSKPAILFISKQIRARFKSKFDESVILDAIRRTLSEPINLDEVKAIRIPSRRKRVKVETKSPNTNILNINIPAADVPLQSQ
jgi:hypothetical protein